MKVQDVMNTDVDFVRTDNTVKEVSRLIFGRGINGVPVIDKDGRLAGFITEKDIVSRFYPSVQEFIEDPVNTKDFEVMERNIYGIFDLTADKIMSHSPITTHPNTPVLHAHSLMVINKIGRLPVVDNNGKLMGIVSKGDIFRSVVAGKIPHVEDEEYHDWLSRHWDLIIKSEERLSYEVPDLTKLFKQKKSKKILDVGSGTGGHDISLVKNGFEVLAMERSTLMSEKSSQKKKSLPKSLQGRVKFQTGDYTSLLKDKDKSFDAAIFMGNALSHNPYDYKKILESVSRALRKNNSLLVVQIANFDKIFKENKRFQDFNVGSFGKEKELAFLEFYDPPREKGGFATLNMAILMHNGKKWLPRASNSTPIVVITKETITPILKSFGFKEISFYGSKFSEHLFEQEFNSSQSDWLNVVAVR